MRTREVKPDEVGARSKDDPFASMPASQHTARSPEMEREIQRLRKENSPDRQPVAKEDDSITTKSSTKEPELEELRDFNEAPAGEDWIRQDLPSRLTPYKVKEIFVRPLRMPALSKLFAANRAESLSQVLDAIDPYISLDVRMLTPEDFDFFMFWLRENSYKRSPLKFPFTTRYGNSIDVEIRLPKLEITELEMTASEYKEWQEKGICFPTMRDVELIKNAEDYAEDTRWMLECAQYIPLPKDADPDLTYVENKMKVLENGGLDIYENIQEFKSLIDHGVTESVSVKDTSFEPLVAATYFRENANDLSETLALIPSNSTEDDLHVLRIASLIKVLLEEATELERKVEAGERVEPIEEVVAVSISATDFFPAF